MSTDTVPRSKQRNFRFPVETSEALDELAARLDVNAVDLVLEGVARVLARPGNLRNVARARPAKRKRHRRSEEASGNRDGSPRSGNGADGSASPSGVDGRGRASASPRAAVHLPTVLATWTRMPVAIMRGEIVLGKVTIGGAVVKSLDVPGPVDRAAVRWNGEPV